MNPDSKKMLRTNLLLVLMVAALVVIPLALYGGADFGGADGEAEKVISEINPDYQPWFQSIWEPPGGEIESLLFALQAAIGGGFIGYYFGYVRGKRKGQGRG